MSQTLTEAIKEDHEEMYEYYGKYQKAIEQNNIDAAERWSRQLIWEVARHAVAEEIVVYPLMENKLGSKGKALADHDRSEHTLVKKYLTHLDTLISEAKVGTPEYKTEMEKCMKHLKNHNDDEERDDLPLLEPTLGEEGSKSAASSFGRTKKFVPTRAHLDAPNKPPYETLAGFILAPIDMLKDVFAKFPTEEMKSES